MIGMNTMSRSTRKPTICICENKGADQLCSNCTADRRRCFRSTDSIIPLLIIPKISSFQPNSVTVQAGLCRAWSEFQIVDISYESSNHRFRMHYGNFLLKVSICYHDFSQSFKKHSESCRCYNHTCAEPFVLLSSQ